MSQRRAWSAAEVLLDSVELRLELGAEGLTPVELNTNSASNMSNRARATHSPEDAVPTGKTRTFGTRRRRRRSPAQRRRRRPARSASAPIPKSAPIEPRPGAPDTRETAHALDCMTSLQGGTDFGGYLVGHCDQSATSVNGTRLPSPKSTGSPGGASTNWNGPARALSRSATQDGPSRHERPQDCSPPSGQSAAASQTRGFVQTGTRPSMAANT